MAVVTTTSLIGSLCVLVARGGGDDAATPQVIDSFLLIGRFLTFEGHLAGFGHDKVG